MLRIVCKVDGNYEPLGFGWISWEKIERYDNLCRHVLQAYKKSSLVTNRLETEEDSDCENLPVTEFGNTKKVYNTRLMNCTEDDI
jgi:hypothetical protein